MPVLPTTAYSQAEDALTLARALVNDTSGAVFTDTLLMPLLNSAYRGLQRELAENGVSVLMEQQDIELDLIVTTGVTNTEISDVSQPAASHRLPDAARVVGARHGEYRRRLRAHGEIHQRRQDAEPAAQHATCGCGNGERTRSI